jgi:hypothetical protein
VEREQVAQGVDRRVELAAVAAFVPVIAGAMTVLRGRLARRTVKNGGDRPGRRSPSIAGPRFRRASSQAVPHERPADPR